MKFGSKHNKKPQVHKTTEQLINEANKRSEFLAKMEFIKTKFYPALINATTSIEDATQNLTILNSFMMEAFLAKMKEVKFGELKLQDKLSTNDPKYDQLKEMLDLFNDMSIFETKEYLEGVKMEIEVFKNDYWKDKTLDQLQTKWADEL